MVSGGKGEGTCGGSSSSMEDSSWSGPGEGPVRSSESSIASDEPASDQCTERRRSGEGGMYTDGTCGGTGGTCMIVGGCGDIGGGGYTMGGGYGCWNIIG